MASLAALALTLPLSSPLIVEQADLALPKAPITQEYTSAQPVKVANVEPAFISLAWSLQAAPGSSQNVSGSSPDPQPTNSEQDGPAQGEDASANGDDPPENVIVVSSAYGPPKEDPLMRVNEAAFDIGEDIDQALVGPIAYAYEDGLPSPIRDGLRNVSQNLREPVNFINFLLQGKVGKAAETLGRFAINSSLGIGGLIDIAAKDGIGLPYRRNGFSNTMGFYGVGDGPFMVLPVAGTTTLRDFIGSGLDQLVLPTAVGKPFNTLEYAVPAYVINSLNTRIDIDKTLSDARETGDPYVALREEYLGERKAEIEALRNGDADAGIPGIDRFQPEWQSEVSETGPATGLKGAAAAPETAAQGSGAGEAEAAASDEDKDEDAAGPSANVILRTCEPAAPCSIGEAQFPAERLARVYFMRPAIPSRLRGGHSRGR
jgi:phospholipid-binding lipoprotein MlaA